MATNIDNRELGWDDEVSQESTFTLLEEGDYRFSMIDFNRVRYSGSAKIPPCTKVILDIAILDKDGRKLTTLKHNLFLHSSVEGLVSAFFLSTGAKKHGEPLIISKGFQESFGRTGWCHVYVDRWTGDDGKVRESNKIKNFIAPENAPKEETAPTAPAAQASFAGWGTGTNFSNR